MNEYNQLPCFFPISPGLYLEAIELNYDNLKSLHAMCGDKERFEYAVFKPYECVEDGFAFLLQASNAWHNIDNKRFLYGIYCANQLAGLIELKFLEENNVEFCSLGYNVSKYHSGKGLAQISAQKLIDWVFQHTNTPYFELWHRKENKASARVMEKLGFQPVIDTFAQITSHKGVISKAVVERLYR